ncbi:MAG: cysteine desulfurase [Chitinophagaceae bacterium]|nr:MAG: cysteine desulfurase [Chitinophagaceae bacterium]
MNVYLDNAATTAIDPRVLEAMMPFLKDNYGNPSSIHTHGREAKAGIEKARKSIASNLNASTGEVFFTSGGTEAVNMAIKCAVTDLGVETIITSPLEHHCVLHSCDCVKSKHNINIVMLDFDENGNPDLQQLESILSKKDTGKTLVSLMHANNEIGNLLDIKKVSEICRTHGALLHSDAVQTVGHYPLDLQELDIDFLSGSAHKFHGPKGIGFIYINENLTLKPFIDGGSQERNMRAGTENIYGIIGMAKALDICMENFEEEKKHIEGLKFYFAEKLLSFHPEISINGNFPEQSLYTILSVSLPSSMPTDMFLFNLDMSNIAVSAGSACSSGSNTGSHVIKAIYGEKNKHSSIRFSFSKFNTMEEADYVLEKVKRILPQEVSM